MMLNYDPMLMYSCVLILQLAETTVDLETLTIILFILYGGLRCTFQIHISEEGSSGRDIYMLSYVKIIFLKCHPQKGVYDVAT